MDKTQNIFEKIRARLKKYRFNWSTQKVEHDEFVEIEHVNHADTKSNDKRKLFKLRGSAVVVSTFLVLLGAGAVDAQTRAYEVIYKGTSIGCVDDLQVLETAVSDINKGKSGRVNRGGTDYEIRLARSTEVLTTAEVAKEIVEIRTQEKVEVAQDDSLQQVEDSQVPETSTLATVAVETPTGNGSSEESVKNTASVGENTTLPAASVEIPVVEIPVSETPVLSAQAVEVPVTETTQTPVSETLVKETPVPETLVVEAPVAEVPAVEAPVVETPAVENPAVENPAQENPVVETPVAESPAVEVPVVEAPIEAPVEAPAVETPQAQFMLPASGRIGEILRAYDGGYYSNHYRAAAVDILNNEGTSVYAAASGTVTLSSWYGGYGKCVIIDHGNGYSTLYGHFSSVDVSEGQTVTQGQRIGGMGSTGSSTANHVHFEVRVNNEAQPISNYFSINTGDYI